MPIHDSQPSLRLYLLGGFRVERAGQSVPDSRWERRSAKQLIKVLAVVPEHRLHREQVQELLWTDLTPEAGYGSLRKSLHLARRALEPELERTRSSKFLRFSDAVLALDSRDLWIDADAFEGSMERALVGSEASEVEAALALYLGPLLPEDIYEDWTAPRRQDLAVLFRRGLLHLATLREHEEDSRAAIELLQRVVREDPTDEEAYGRLMRLYAANGSRHLALREYEVYASALRRELDAEPSEETTAIYTEILEGPSPETALRRSPKLPFSAPHLPPGTFVGRERPKAILLQALGFEADPFPAPRPAVNSAKEPDSWNVESGYCHLILVGGEAGVGKTRLLLELATEAAARGALILWGSSYESEGKMAYGPLVEALRAHLATRQETEKSAIAARFPQLCSLLPIVSDAATTPNPAVNPDRERRQLYSGVLRLLIELTTDGSDHRPLLFVLDDIHEADQATLHLVHYLAREAANRNWLFVGSYRYESGDRGGSFGQWLAGVTRSLVHQRVDLLPLARAECDQLVQAMLNAQPDPMLLDRVYALSRGNPLFASELATLQKDSDAVLASSGSTPSTIDDAASDGGSWSIPERVQELIAARVHALGSGAWDALTLAAIAGMEWQFVAILTAVQDVLPDQLSPSELLDVMDRAVEARIIEERPGARGEVVYGFRHPLFREALYQRVSRARRQYLHLTLARVMELHHPEHVENLAYHYVAGGNAERASVYLERAGDHAASVYANELAVTYYQESVNWLMQLGRLREAAAVRFKLARVLARLARTDEALQELEESIDAYRQGGDLEAEVHATAELAQVYAQRGHPREGIKRLQPLLGPLSALGPSRELAAAYLAFANLHLAAGDYLEQLQTSEAASAVARSIGANLLHAQAESRRGAALALLGRLKEADEVARATLPTLESGGDLPTLARTTNNLAWGAMLAGDFEQHRRYAQQALDLAQRVGDPALVGVDTSSLGRAYFYLNDYRSARSLMEEGVRTLEALGPSSQTAYAHAYLGQLTEAEGNFEEARRLLDMAANIGREAGDLQVLRIAAVWLSEMDVWEGLIERARNRLEPLLPVGSLCLDKQGTLAEVDMLFVLPAVASVSQRLASAGRPALPRVQPEEMTAHVIERCRSLGTNLYLQWALCGYGEILALQGKWETAEAALREALSLSRAMNFHWRELTALRGLLLLHRLRGEPEQEQDCVLEADKILNGLGADRMAARFSQLTSEPTSTGVSA